MIDADDMLVGEFTFPHDVPMDAYSLRIQRGNFTWWRNQIFKIGAGWEYIGVLHEYAHIPDKPDITQARIQTEGYHIEARTLGARNIVGGEDKTLLDVKEKYLRDAEVLKSALTNPEDPAYEPENARYHFYLAQSYFDAQDWENAKIWYEKRAEMGGWEEEVFYSWYRVAMCASLCEENWPVVCQMFLRAWEYRPIRSEALYQIARIYRLSGHPRLAYMFAKQANDIPFPANDILFLPDELHAWQILDEIGSTAFYVGNMQEGHDACMQLLKDNKFPESERGRIMGNLEQYQLALQQMSELQEQEKQRHEELQKNIEERSQKEKEERLAKVKAAEAKKKKEKNKKKRTQAKKSRKAQKA